MVLGTAVDPSRSRAGLRLMCNLEDADVVEKAVGSRWKSRADRQSDDGGVDP